MKILTRRNAMLGWATWKTAKGIAKYQKAKKALPTTAPKKTSKKKKFARVAGVGAAIGGVALLKRKRKHAHEGGDSPTTSGQ
jgi:LPXTG cell wall anchor motif